MSRRWVAVSAVRAAVAQDLALAHTVLGGEPVPHRDIECGAGRVTQILYTIAAVDGELHRVDAVGEVESKIGKISGTRRGYLQRVDPQRSQGLTQLRIEPHGVGVDISAGGQQHNRAGREGVISPWVREQEHSQIQARFLRPQQSFGKVAIALLLLQLRLHQIGVCPFAGALSRCWVRLVKPAASPAARRATATLRPAASSW